MNRQNSIDFTTFRENLKSLVRARHVYMKDVAEETGITKTTLSRYITGERTPDLEYVVRLADFFGVTMEYLLGLNDTQYRVVSDDEEYLLDCYSLMSESDRNVINAVMQKYGETS